MKCIKCKNKINKSDKFCFECGTKIEKRELNAFINGKVVIFTGILFSLICVFLLGYSFNKKLKSPEEVATEYFETVIRNNSNEIYPYIEEYSDSPFVSEKMLSDKMVRLGKIENYSIKGVEEKDGKILVEFQYDLDGEYQTSYVELKKEKIYKYFDSYKVVSGKLASNVILRVLAGSTIKVDDKEISNYLNEKDDDEYYDTYEMPDMIAGIYKVDITLKNGLKLYKEFSVASNNKYTLSKINLTEELANPIQSKIKDSLNVLYKSAVDGKNYEDINKFKNDLSSLYRSIKRSMNSSNKTVLEIDFTNVEAKLAMFNDKGNLEVEIFADYDMEYIDNTIAGNKKITISDYMSLSVELDENYEIINIYTSYSEKDVVYE